LIKHRCVTGWTFGAFGGAAVVNGKKKFIPKLIFGVKSVGIDGINANRDNSRALAFVTHTASIATIPVAPSSGWPMAQCDLSMKESTFKR
jgi:hypothetical protein